MPDRGNLKELYEKHPLPTQTSTRVVKLKSTPSNHGFSCSFEVIDLARPPNYYALSYVWGLPGETELVEWDGFQVSVPKNVYDMLKNFVSSAPNLFWVDALSINQDALSERNQQVTLMADIYSKAICVNVWLGLDPGLHSAKIFHGHLTLARILKDITEKGGQFEYVSKEFERIDEHTEKEASYLHWKLGDGKSRGDYLPEGIFSPTQKSAEGLVEFFNLPWFSRTWILQEAGLASEVWMYWGAGGSKISWNIVGVTALFLLRYARGTLLQDLGLIEAVENVWQAYRTFSPFEPLSTFFHILTKARKFQVTDPRDKIFALLSHPTAHSISIVGALPGNASSFGTYVDAILKLLRNHQERWIIERKWPEAAKSRQADAENRKPLIEVDYSKTVQQLYEHVAIEHIERTISLEILSAVQHDPFEPELKMPSWVPQWHEALGTPILGLVTSAHLAAANRDAIFTVPSPSNPSVLLVRGTVISRVMYASRLLDSASFDLPNEHRPNFAHSNAINHCWYESGLGPIHAEGERYPRFPKFWDANGTAYFDKQGEDLMKAYQRTWAAGNNALEADSIFDVDLDGYQYWTRLYLDTMRTLWPLRDAEMEESLRPETEAILGEENERRAERYRASVVHVAARRKFFVTKKGVMGLGPGALREGDWLAVLLGADVPFVLREVGGDEREPGPFPDDVRFQLVGECYAHGMMAGEAVRGQAVERDIALV